MLNRFRPLCWTLQGAAAAVFYVCLLAAIGTALPPSVEAQGRARVGWESWREPRTAAVIAGLTCNSTRDGHIRVATDTEGIWVCNGTTWVQASTAATSGGNGSTWTQSFAAESITLSTAGTTTDSTANLLPANSLIKAVTCRVTTTIGTATDWAVGDPTTATRFSSANSTLTAGTTSVGLNHMRGSVTTDAAGPTQTAAAKLRITTTGTPSAGVIRCVVYFETFVAPTS